MNEWVSVALLFQDPLNLAKFFLEGQEIETILGELMAVGYIPFLC